MRVIDLRKVSIATSCWENNYGMRVEKKPEQPTFLGARMHEKRPLQQADTWTFCVIFEFGSRRTETFYGTRAISLWSAWKAKQFGESQPRRKQPRQSLKHKQQLELL